MPCNASLHVATVLAQWLSAVSIGRFQGFIQSSVEAYTNLGSSKPLGSLTGL